MRWPALLAALLIGTVLAASGLAHESPPEIAGLIKALSIPPGESEASLTLRNPGDHETVYALELDGPAWARIEPASLIVPAGASREFMLIFTPPGDFTAGELTIRAIPAEGDVAYTKTLRVRAASEAAVFLLRNLAVIVAAVVPILLSFIIGVTLRIAKARGERTQVIREPKPARPVIVLPKPRLSFRKHLRKAMQAVGKLVPRPRPSFPAPAMDPFFQPLSLPKLTAKASAPAPAALKLDLPPEPPVSEPEGVRKRWLSNAWTRMRGDILTDLKSRYRLVPKGSFARKREGARLRWPYGLAFMAVAVVALAALYRFRAEFMANISYAFVGLGLAIVLGAVLTSAVFDRKVRRWRFVPARREAAVRTGWFSGLGEVAFRLFKHGEDIYLQARKGRQEAVYAVPGSRVYQYFHTAWNLEDAALEHAAFSFRVPKSWLSRGGVTPANVQLVRHEDGRWTPIDTQLTGEDGRWAYYQAKGHSWGQFAIAGRPTGFPRRFPWPAAVGGVLGVLLVLVAALAAGRFMPETGTRESWLQDTSRTVDLARYFSQPGLTGYAVAELPAHVNVTVDGSVAVLTPEPGWSGTDQVVFSAGDGTGKTIATQAVDLSVRKPLVTGILRNYVWHATVGAIILIIFILAVEFRKPLIEFLEE
jgi:hypothetical protein